MKLLYCKYCQDMFKLDYEIRSCKCGKCRGRYDDNGHTAVTNGEGQCVAIGNGSLWSAMAYGGKHDVMCWVRPHSGEHNPRSRVNKKL